MVIDEKQLKELTDNIMEVKTALEAGGKKNDLLLEKLGISEKTIETMRSELNELRRMSLTARAQTSSLRPGQVVTDECAEWLACTFINELNKKEKLDGNVQREALMARVNKVLQIQARAAVGTGDIPLPVDYSGQIVELVWKYGQARQFGTVYPMSTITLKLPKLTTSPAFALIAASGAVGEKVPQIGFVTFTADKWGGIVRYPTEIDMDSIVPLGQFLARYVAREMAKIEDNTFWAADGSGTYGGRSGLLLTQVTAGYKIVTSSGNTSPSQITLANLRNLRTKVTSAALAGSAYYMNLTMESLLVSFNTSATVVPYIANGLKGPTLDGFPVRWVDVLPVNTTSATVSANQVGFGDASYHYLGVRSGLRVDLSREVYFATDEWGLRALEQFDAQLMATNPFSTLALAAS